MPAWWPRIRHPEPPVEMKDNTPAFFALTACLMLLSFAVLAARAYIKKSKNGNAFLQWLQQPSVFPTMMVLSFFANDRIISMLGHAEQKTWFAQEIGSMTCVLMLHCVTFLTSLLNLYLWASHQHFRSRVIGLTIELLVCYTYGTILLGAGSGAVFYDMGIFWNLHFNLSRINLWAHSTALQVALFASLSPEPDASQELLHVAKMLWVFIFSSLANLVPQQMPRAFWITVALFVASCFMQAVVMRFCCGLVSNCFAPLAEVDETFKADAFRVAQRLSTVLPALICVGWTGFPVIFFAADALYITSATSEICFGLLEMYAKAFFPAVLQSSAFVWLETLSHASLTKELSLNTAIMHSLQLFTQSIGHDLRTPLQALMYCNTSAQRELVALTGMISPNTDYQAALRNIAAELSHKTDSEKYEGDGSQLNVHVEKLYRHLKESEASAELLGCIVSNLWDFEAIMSQKKEKKNASPGIQTTLNINSIVMQLVDVLRLSPIGAQRRSVRLQVLTDPLIPPDVIGDRSLVVRALLNIIVNALKFTEAGHVTVRTTCVSALSKDSRTVVVGFEVIDTGRGMDAHQLSMSTRPYFRSSETSSGGLGLGLTIVTNSVENAGGKFHISSEVGVGTRCGFDMSFLITDPLRAQPVVASLKKRVMLVDDVDILVEGASDVVDSLSHTVVFTACNGKEALKLMIENHDGIDVVFMDIQMPVMRGDQATVELRKWEDENLEPNARRLVVFACTGNVTSTDVEAHLRCGFDGCVSKPVHPSTLEQVLNGSTDEVKRVLLNPYSMETAAEEASNSCNSSSGKSSTSNEVSAPLPTI